MHPLSIAYIGEPTGNSALRCRALMRLGHKVHFVDHNPPAYRNEIGRRYLFRIGGFFDQTYILSYLKAALKGKSFDLIVVNQGDFLGPKVVSFLKTKAPRVACYVNDNPFAHGISDWRFRQFRRAAHLYDLIAIIRRSNLPQLKEIGVKRSISVWCSADEVAHLASDVHHSEGPFSNEVCFIGTWFPERGPFICDLINAGIHISIWGDNWHKAPEWDCIKSHHRGDAVSDPALYSQIIYSAKVALCLLSEKNNDLHTRRSAEIPAIGGVLLAPRTRDHLEMYEEGVEAMFYEGAMDCAAKCKELLANEDLRANIRKNGRARVIRSGYLNERVMETIIEETLK